MKMDCSRCEFAVRIKEASRAGIRYRYEDSPCSACGLEEGPSRAIEFDETRGVPQTRGQKLEVGGQPEEQELPVSVLAEAVRLLLELPQRTFRILQRRFRGDSYRLIGEELNVTPQAAEIQLRRALEAHPHLKHLLPEKARRQAARKRKRLSMARRGKPGAGSR